ncbi:MAG: hypothetical protein AAGE65_00105 [Planctomycetota bacterium]
MKRRTERPDGPSRAGNKFNTLKPRTAMSNAERQLLFRDRHPGYFKKYFARDKAARLCAEGKHQARALRTHAETLAARYPLSVAVILTPHPDALATFWCTKPRKSRNPRLRPPPRAHN